MEFKVFQKELELQSRGWIPTFHDVTTDIVKIGEESGIKNGTCCIASHHTTCSVITQEAAFDMSMTGLETLQQDFVDVLERVSPECTREGIYLHPGPKAIKFADEHGEDLRGCHNTDAHLRSALIGRGECIALIDGEMDLGDFGFIYFIDFDKTRARERTVQVMIIGE